MCLKLDNGMFRKQVNTWFLGTTNVMANARHYDNITRWAVVILKCLTSNPKYLFCDNHCPSP